MENRNPIHHHCHCACWELTYRDDNGKHTLYFATQRAAEHHLIDYGARDVVYQEDGTSYHPLKSTWTIQQVG